MHIQLQNLKNWGTSDPPVSQVRAAAMLLIVTEGNGWSQITQNSYEILWKTASWIES
jgi:hypothetical protein